ncbi:energy-coupling factor ABC transporter permease [Streptomyces ovatisporus]|uniref:Energy-coupling factor ABC transporter permease n=1 Tax=Streptomyces ovatisporus TaxID=1128682 RepID=A0ABV9A5T1_9ACTN
MHVPDGFIDAPVSVAAGAVAAGAVALSLRGARRELGGGSGALGPSTAMGGERTAPLAGLVAAFVFAVQMLNFPVAAGTSGHLLGGALAAILVGPFTGVLCISVVLLMQGLLFADGGLTALGVNIVLMGVVTVLVAYGLLRGLLRVLPRRRGSVTAASFVAALVSVPASAIAFTGLYAVGGTADVALGKVFAAMAGVHVLIGLGEAAITAATVGAVIAVRPDLVYGARELASGPLKLRTAAVATPGDGTAGTPSGAGRTEPPAAQPADPAPAQPADPAPAQPAQAPAPPRSNRRLWLGGLLVTVLCAGIVSFYASASPDGLEKVAADNGIDEKARDHAAADSPLADYGIEDIADARLSGGLAGVIGAGVTLAVGSGVFVAVRRRQPETTPDAADAGAHADAARTGT